MKWRVIAILQFIALCTIAACAGIDYKHYNISMPDPCYDKGKLVGNPKKGWDDLPLTDCKPDAQDKGKCVLQLTEDWYKKDTELLKCRSALDDCQRGNPIK